MRWSGKIGIVFALGFLGFTGFALAETVYVTDELRLGLRSGPGTNYEIVEIARSGQAMERLNVEGNWARVRMPDGKEGWVPERYLTSTATDNLRLERLQNQYVSLRNQAENLQAENRRLNRELRQLRSELEKNAREADEATEAYENLKSGSAEYLQLKAGYENATARLAEQNKRLRELNARVDTGKSQRIIRWLLTGAGVVLLGFIIGISVRRQKRSSLLS